MGNILAWVPGPFEIGIIVVVGVIIFGRNLPTLARNVGKSFVEFKKGFKDIDDEVSETTEDLKKEIEEIKKVKDDAVADVQEVVSGKT